MFVSDRRSSDTEPGDNQPMVFELERSGSTSPMIVTGSSAEQAAREITVRLEPGLWWDQVVQHVPVELAEAARAAASNATVDALVAVGGSTIGLDPRVLPVTMVYDAAPSRSLPVALSVASGFNGMAHCVDSLWAPGADPALVSAMTEYA